MYQNCVASKDRSQKDIIVRGGGLHLEDSIDSGNVRQGQGNAASEESAAKNSKGCPRLNKGQLACPKKVHGQEL